MHQRNFPSATSIYLEIFIPTVATISTHQLLATCSLDRRIMLWDLLDFKYRGELVGHGHGIRDIVSSGQISSIVRVHKFMSVVIWNPLFAGLCIKSRLAIVCWF